MEQIMARGFSNNFTLYNSYFSSPKLFSSSSSSSSSCSFWVGSKPKLGFSIGVCRGSGIRVSASVAEKATAVPKIVLQPMKEISGTVKLPGSKSLSNQILFLAALSEADICHAYHIMKNGGLEDENIIVFMYDDIAYNKENPRPGVIINHPQGGDMYAGVPKDYVGDDVNIHNFLAVILGNKTALAMRGYSSGICRDVIR